MTLVKTMMTAVRATAIINVRMRNRICLMG